MSRPTSGPSPGDGGDGGDGNDGDGGASRAREPRVGSRIGPYRLVRLLGAGSSGRVFEVEHEKIGRRAAMKTLSAEHATRPGAVQRLFKEAMAVNRINNPHIVEVTDLVEDGEHRPPVGDVDGPPPPRVNAIVMELLEGRSLGQALAAVEPMPPERFLPLVAQVCRALAAAHAAGFVHRDLKPENIFLVERTGADFVKLLDFGLAKAVDADPAAAANLALATQEGTFIGTPGYVSPEQATGGAVDHRTDIYAVGVILFEIVSGRLPFEGHSIGDYLVKHVTEAPPPFPSAVLATPLGRSLDAIAQRCLAKNPQARFATAAELAETLEALARGEDIRLPQVTRRSRTIRPRQVGWRRRPLGLGLAIVFGTFGALGVAALVVSLRRSPAPGPAATLEAPGLPAAAMPVAPPLPLRTTLSFESDPPGAEVFQDSSGASLGKTPFARSFERSAAPFGIEVRLAGYEPVRIMTTADASRIVSVRLTHQAAPARKPHERAPHEKVGADRDRADEPAAPLEREKTIDPFR